MCCHEPNKWLCFTFSFLTERARSIQLAEDDSKAEPEPEAETEPEPEPETEPEGTPEPEAETQDNDPVASAQKQPR